jgi:hypothetical protein
MMNWLNGKKTYLCSLAGGLAFVAYLLGYIDEATFNRAALIFGFGGLAALRAGVTKSGPDGTGS